MILAKNIKLLRQQNNYTMKALGELVGLTESSISYYEKGEREPSIGTLMKMSELFSVSVDFLLTGKEQKSILEKRPTLGDSLNTDEKELLKMYKLLNSEGKKSLLNQAEMHALMSNLTSNGQAKRA